MRRCPAGFTACAIFAVVGCGVTRQSGSPGAFFTRLPLGASALLPIPADNPLGCEQAELGRRLFVETRLSKSGKTSCATCHRPERAFTDGRAIAVGDDGTVGRRNSPTLLDRAYGHRQFFDGRVETLEQQALLPLSNPVELASTGDEILRRLSVDPSYRRQFARAFGSGGISLERLASAIASFERTLVTGDAPADRFVLLGDSGALDPAARRGLELFRGKASCISCHEPFRFTDERFHNTGAAWRGGVYRDSGRYAVTRRVEDLGAFKTPTLRNVALTAPYMHDGSIATLDEVIAFYDRGGNPNPNLDPLLRPLGLTEAERIELLAFLRSLTGAIPRAERFHCAGR